MLAALISDQHIHRATRWEECLRILAWIVTTLSERRPDVILLGGDLFEARSLPEERNAAKDWLLALAAIAPVVGVYGNHDAPGDLEVFNHLEAPHPIRFYDRPAVHRLPGGAIACLPWPRKAQLLATLGAPVAGEQANAIAGQALQHVLTGFGAELDELVGERIFLGHCMVRGSRTSTGQPLVGCDFEVGTEDLGLVGADVYLLGHVHASQAWEINGAPCLYPGSPRRTAFGEVEEKRIALVRVEERRAEVEYVATPAARMILVEMEWHPLLLLQLPAGSLSAAGAEIRLRYHVDSDQRAPAREDAERWARTWRAAGAVHVKIEEIVRANVRARAPEIAAAKTLPEKLAAYWAARGIALADDRRARVLARLGELDTEARAA